MALIVTHMSLACYDCNVKGHLLLLHPAIFTVDPFYRPFGRLSVTGPGVEPLLRVLWGRHFFALSLFYTLRIKVRGSGYIKPMLLSDVDVLFREHNEFLLQAWYV